MEPLFVTEGISDKKFLNETIPVLRKNSIFFTNNFVLLLLILNMGFLGGWAQSHFEDYSFLFPIPIPFTLLYFLCYFFIPRQRIHKLLKQEKNLLKENGFNRISFFSDSFQVQTYKTEIISDMIYPYTAIASVALTTSLFCFSLKINKKNYILSFNKNSFIKGNATDFILFLKSESLLQ